MFENKKLIRFDWAMKNILRQKDNFDILEGFLSTLLNEEIKVLHLLESESNQDDERDKFNRVDLMVEDQAKRKIIIEIQNNNESDYLERLLYGTSKVITENMKLGERFHQISKVISISILYFNFGRGKDYLYKGTTHFESLNQLDNLYFSKRIYDENQEKKFHLGEKNIFPEYYLLFVGRYENIIKHAIDEWLYLFKNDELKSNFNSKNIKLCQEKLDVLNMSHKEKKVYEKYLIDKVVKDDVLETAENKGLKKGLIKGEEIGLEKGLEKGAKQKSLEIAKSLKLAGLNNEIIIKSTGLTIEEVEKL